MGKKSTKYSAIVGKIFENHYKKGETKFTWEREEMVTAAEALGIALPKNLGDLIYSFRFRTPFPESITSTAPEGMEWVIKLAGRGVYRFALTKINRIEPTESMYQIKIPDSTPEIIEMYSQSDEQALLAKVRYNRLIDIFLGVASYSLQNHLRTTVPEVGQIEIDELYVAVRDSGEHYIIPVQAKGGTDQLGATQIEQDLAYCEYTYPHLRPRAIAVQFIGRESIVMFELTFQDDELKIVKERQYRLVARDDISADDLKEMADLD